MRKKYNKIVTTLFTLALLTPLGVAHASGGEVFSGLAFINPAEYTSVKSQKMTFASTWLIRNVKFKGSVATSTVPTTSGTATNKKPVVFLPDFSYVARLTPKLVISMRRTNPYSIQSDYNAKFMEPIATETDIGVVNYSTSLAYQVTPILSIAAGIDVQELNASLDSIPVLPFLGPQNLDIEGSSWGVGGHAGMILKITPITILSLVYYSPVHHKLRGTSQLGAFPSAKATANITLPANTTLSLIQVLSHHLAAMFSATYTNWSVVQALTVKTVIPFNPSKGIVLPTGYRNTFYFQLGARYIFNKKWYLQGGMSYDRTATNNADRSVRLPGDNVIGVVFGVHYQPIKVFGISIDYGHGFVGKVPINTTQSGETTKGTANVFGNVVSVKFTVGD